MLDYTKEDLLELEQITRKLPTTRRLKEAFEAYQARRVMRLQPFFTRNFASTNMTAISRLS